VDHVLTYRGALQILGRDDRSWLGKVDRALGGLIIAAPAGALAGPAAAAAAAALWGAVDQKNQAIGLIRDALAAISARRLRTAGHQRQELIAAAHTVLVITSYFDALREQVGAEVFELLELTADVQLDITAGWNRDPNWSLVDTLYATDVPAPSATRGFVENIDAVRGWLKELTGQTADYLERWHGQVDFAAVLRDATRNYRENYLRMAADVPEFLVWTSFGEHAATRNEVHGVAEAVLAAINSTGSALSRIEQLLTLDATAPPDVSTARLVVQQMNRAVLNRPIVDDQSPHVEFPTVERIYVNPRYRVCHQDQHTARPWDDTWWSDRQVHNDLDLLLTTHLTALGSTRSPLVLLGHPGAGKSMLAQVLAARLPALHYTVVRVPLRHVDANASVFKQIEEALHASTHGRVSWRELTDQSWAALRVVLLDGLDEMLQASPHRRTGYLNEVAEFQRTEAELDRPTAVIVTSRTVVADLVTIPKGSPVVRLEEFDRDEIAMWLAAWNESNKSLAAAGVFRPLDVDTAMNHPKLAEHPLLLFMLALYSADPNAVPLNADLSKASLYGHLLEDFTRREVARTPGDDPAEHSVEDHLWRLGIVALGMFNRGRQTITEEEVERDTCVLDKTAPADARWTLGQFFFVHLTEANQHVRCFEFLHATFSEYLVARHLRDVIVEQLPSGVKRRDHGNDDLLFAVLSQQPLSNRWPILAFLRELIAELTRKEREAVVAMLRELLPQHRRRPRSERYVDYRPQPTDHVRELAAYSANLVLLRLACEIGKVRLDDLWPGPDAKGEWRSMAELWRAGLDRANWHDLINTVHRDGGSIGLDRSVGTWDRKTETFDHARVLGDHELIRQLRYGLAVNNATIPLQNDGSPDVGTDLLVSGALSTLLHGEVINLVLPATTADSPMRTTALRIISEIVERNAASLPFGAVRLVVRWMYELTPPARLGLRALERLAEAHPWLLEEHPDLLGSDVHQVQSKNTALDRPDYNITMISAAETVNMNNIGWRWEDSAE
jgi:hypothetical protein